jgi:hypothetical protein
LCRGFQCTKGDKLRIFQTQDQSTDQKEGTRCNILGYSFCSWFWFKAFAELFLVAFSMQRLQRVVGPPRQGDSASAEWRSVTFPKVHAIAARLGFWLVTHNCASRTSVSILNATRATSTQQDTLTLLSGSQTKSAQVGVVILWCARASRM